jgi:hypothetical protein
MDLSRKATLRHPQDPKMHLQFSFNTNHHV